MSSFYTLNKIATCNPNIIEELVECSQAVCTVLSAMTVGQEAALERLFYLILSYDRAEQKGGGRDKLHLDLEQNVRKSVEVVRKRLPEYSLSSVTVLVRLTLRTLCQVGQGFKLSNAIHRIMAVCCERLYKSDPDGYVPKIFEMYLSDCTGNNTADSTVLVKTLSPFPDLTKPLLSSSFEAFRSESAHFITYKQALVELSKYNGRSISGAVMQLLDESDAVKQKIGFVLNLLSSIPSLHSVAMRLLSESQAFKALLHSNKSTIPPPLVDDLAKLFTSSEINSFNTVLSLLEQDPTTSLGPSLLSKILLSLELSVYGVSEDKENLFIENMSGSEDINMFCNCLDTLPSHTHPSIIKCLTIICLYKGESTTKKVMCELIQTQPLERFQVLVDTISPVYPNMCVFAFKHSLKDIPTRTPAQIVTFAENSDKLKFSNSHQILASEMVTIAGLIRDTNCLKVTSIFIKFLEPRSIGTVETTAITHILLTCFVNHVTNIQGPDVSLELLETVTDLEGNIVKWCPINDCTRLTILHQLLALVISTDGDVNTPRDLGDNHVVESNVEIHKGQIKRRKPTDTTRFGCVLARQSVTNLLECVTSNSNKACHVLCSFLLDTLCPDVNLEAAWPEHAAMQYTVERDLVVYNTFRDQPLLWNLLEVALRTRCSNLVVIIRALLTVLITFWTTCRVGKCADCPREMEFTGRFFNILCDIDWMPSPMTNASHLLPFISPLEVTALLFEVANFFRLFGPHLTKIPISKHQPSVKETMTSIVQNNIENVGEMMFMFCKWGLKEEA